MFMKKSFTLLKVLTTIILMGFIMSITACAGITTTNAEEVPVSSITVSGPSGAMTISTFHGTMQMTASVLPASATDKAVVWSVINGTGTATISASGLLSALTNGTVTVKATSVGTPTVEGIRVITLSNQDVIVTSIAVSSLGDTAVIDEFHGSVQMRALVLPTDAEDESVIWSVINGTGSATISESGLLTAVSNGTVTVVATSVSYPAINGTKVMTIINQEVLVTSIVVSGAAAATTISVFRGTLQMSAVVLPIDAEDDSVVWSVANGTGSATISASGLLSALSDGTVTVTATSVSTPSISGSRVITISHQEVLVASVVVDGADSVNTISIFHGTLQMSASVLPANAENKAVTWSVANGTGSATISASGLLTAVENGTVTVRATSVGTPEVYGLIVITISNQEVQVASISVSGAGSATTISLFHGTLQMSATVLPANAENMAVTWSVINGTGSATISASGLLTAVDDGLVTVRATSVSTPAIYGSIVITLSNQEVLVNSIVVSGAAAATTISVFHGTLQMSAAVLPANAENLAVSWSVINGTGSATISASGLLTAVSNGIVTVRATSVSTPAVFDEQIITLSNQEVLVSSIVVSGAGDAIIINIDDGNLQMSAAVLPINAEDDSVVWSVINGTGSATISALGLLNADQDGTVTVRATSVSTPAVFGELVITISNQVVVVLLAPVDLGTADPFAILAKTGISTTGVTLITGDIGVSPIDSTAITGFSLVLDAGGTFSTSVLVVGNVYASDYGVPTPTFMTTVIGDLEIAYADAAARTPDFTELYAGDLSGQTLVPGVYKYSTDVLINTNVTLSGSATDVWIFQISGSLSQAAAVQIILDGGALPENVFWQVAGAVAIGASAQFKGTILCMTSIAVGTSATIDGKLFAQTAVTLDANIVG